MRSRDGLRAWDICLEMNGKLVVIGLDGATWDLILPFIGQGELPLFKKWIEGGCCGSLQSTIPALTPPGWTSGFTGVNPGKHNIFDFFALDREEMKLRLVTSKERRYPAFWEIASRKNLMTGLFNIPCSYPADEVNGFMVTGMATPEGATGFAYPPEVEETMKREFKSYSFGAKAALLEAGKRKEFLKDIYRVTGLQEQAAARLLKDRDMDVFLFVYDEIDRVMHFFWHDYDRQHPRFSGNDEFRNAILDYYKRVERGIAGFMSRFGDDADLMIFSDHGFGPLEKDIYVNKLLYEWGFLEVKPVAREMIKKPLWKRALKSVIPPEARKVLREKVKASPLADPLGYIDFEKSRAFYASVSGRSIFILDKENRAGLAGELKERLESYVDGGTGARPFDKVFDRSEIYSGQYLENAPDLLIKENGRYAFKVEWSGTVTAPASQHGCLKSGSHRENGVFLCFGPSFNKGRKIGNSRICDIAPTILHRLGLPAGSEMDGKVIEEIFVSKDEIKYEDYLNIREAGRGHPGDAEDQMVKDQLRSLGYM
jgi:predicted AlkP superfamily phosphohydrolase/phosphomutase